MDLLAASFNGNIERVRELLDAGEQQTCDVNKMCPVHYASMNGHAAVLRLLLAAGADPLQPSGDLGSTALHWAAAKGQTETLVILLNVCRALPTWSVVKDSQGFSVLHAAVQGGFVMAVFLVLLYLKEMPHFQDLLDQRDTTGKTALMWAAYQSDVQSLRLLLQYKADVFCLDQHKQTALHCAATRDSVEVLMILLQAGLGFELNDRGQSAEMISNGMFKGVYERARYNLKSRGWDDLCLWPVLVLVILPLVWNWNVNVAIAATFVLPMLMHLRIYRAYLFDQIPKEASRNRDRYLKTIFISTFVLLLFNWFCILYLTRGWLLLGHPALLLCFIGTGYNYHQCLVRNPGHLSPRDPIQNHQEIFDDVQAMIQQDIAPTLSTLEPFTFNRIPLRARYCAIDGRVCARFDHHCPWIGKCVGVYNNASFLGFICCMGLGLVVLDLLCWPVWDDLLNSTRFMLIWSNIQLTWVLPLILFQSYQVSRNLTTWEMSNLARHGSIDPGLARLPLELKKRVPDDRFRTMLKIIGLDRILKPQVRYARQKNPYDRGVMGNVRDFWTYGAVNGVDWLRLYEIPVSGLGV